MSVMIVTSLGELVIDLYTDRCPLTCKNFLKLCKIKYYNGCLFHTIQKDFTAQTGDPSGIGTGGDSIYKFLYGDQARFFSDEVHLDLKHLKVGTVAMASAGENLNASQFYITLREKLDYLDGKHTVFGEVAEGEDTLMRINDAYADETGRPFKNIRIKHTYILDDPFEDPPQLAELIPDASPEGKPKDEVEDDVRLEDDWVPMDEQLPAEQLEEIIRAKEAHSRAVVLESIGDIPDADVKPPENVLFVCKLNPVTEDEDLHTIFSRFGTVTSAEVIRDYKTGDSLCYAFIEFESQEACEQAYFKMDNALIDDRRIHVDFSQSVSKLWNQFRRKGGKQGKGCFKCGALDHIAKDCPSESGDSTVKPPQRYTLKVDNRQHGGGDNSRYEMVFAEDEGGRRNSSSKRERSSDDVRQRDHDAKDSRDRYRRTDRSRISEEDEKRYSSRADGHDSGSRRHEEREYNRTEDGDGRHDRAYRKRGIDYDRREDKADNLKRINAEGERRDRRDEQSHRRKDDDRYRSSNRREGRDHHGRRSSEVHGDDERDRGRRERRDSRR